jgi:inosine-uridine nucleoside N-ribohydrolase
MTKSDWPTEIIEPRQRIICDNDYGGDPDGLVQLAHHLLCPGVQVRCVIGSSEAPFFNPWEVSVSKAVEAARRIAELTNRQDVPVVAGPSRPLPQDGQPDPSLAADAIVAEAMRDDTPLPLFVVCGAGLTSVASAWLTEPRIAERLTVIWIGGNEHPGLAEPMIGGLSPEYNCGIDISAAQVVFNRSDLAVWQVPRNVYRQVIASRSEMLVRMRTQGPLGEHLFDALGEFAARFTQLGMHMGETYVLGDSPLVLLTALWSNFDPAPASSEWVLRPRPRINDAGDYEANPDGPPLRVFTRLDVRLLLEDLYARLALLASV